MKTEIFSFNEIDMDDVDDKEILCTIADNLCEKADLKFIDTNTQKEYTSAWDAPENAELRFKNKYFRFTITTNGVLLNDEIQEFVNKEMDNVVLSLDGRKEINDQMRPFRNGTGSYDLIVPKFQKLAESRNQEKYYIRGTFTRNNLDFSNDIMHFADLGFKQMSIEPVVGDESDPYAIREEDIPKILEEYENGEDN